MSKPERLESVCVCHGLGKMLGVTMAENMFDDGLSRPTFTAVVIGLIECRNSINGISQPRESFKAEVLCMVDEVFDIVESSDDK